MPTAIYQFRKIVLFNDAMESLTELINNAEEMVLEFNSEVGESPELVINLGAVKDTAKQQTPQKVSYLVDLARADALDCRGDSQQSIELIDKWVQYEIRQNREI
jgi:hypothetical protein